MKWEGCGGCEVIAEKLRVQQEMVLSDLLTRKQSSAGDDRRNAQSLSTHGCSLMIKIGAIMLSVLRSDG